MRGQERREKPRPRWRRPTKKGRAGFKPSHDPESRLFNIGCHLHQGKQASGIAARQGTIVRSPSMIRMLENQAELLDRQAKKGTL